MQGEDGRNYMFLLKGHEDLRQDERVMQLFGQVRKVTALPPPPQIAIMSSWIARTNIATSIHICIGSTDIVYAVFEEKVQPYTSEMYNVC